MTQASLRMACMCRVDIYETLRPFQELLQEYSAMNATVADAGRGVSAYIAQVLAGHMSLSGATVSALGLCTASDVVLS